MASSVRRFVVKEGVVSPLDGFAMAGYLYTFATRLPNGTWRAEALTHAELNLRLRRIGHWHWVDAYAYAGLGAKDLWWFAMPDSRWAGW